jgi:hypothetical protein
MKHGFYKFSERTSKQVKVLLYHSYDMVLNIELSSMCVKKCMFPWQLLKSNICRSLDFIKISVM